MSETNRHNAALAWIVSDDTGLSSRAIWAHMMGVTPTRGGLTFHPLDPDDFGRCYRLLLRVPEWGARIGEMARHGPVWAALAAAWDELTALYEEEVGPGLDEQRRYFGKRAPRLYDRMKELEREAREGVAR